MQVDVETDKLRECFCGYRPKYYTVGYGRTPYSVYCEGCGNKSGYRGGIPQNIIDHWNDEARFRDKKSESQVKR